MKELMTRYARYNEWANKRLIEVMLPLNEELLSTASASSFESLEQTVLHLWSAESIWLQRLQLEEKPIWQQSSFSGSFSSLCEAWTHTSGELTAFVRSQYNDQAFDHVLQYYNLKKQSMKQKVSDVLLHTFNHATYHRGQLITMLHQRGVTKLPATDFIAFVGK